MNSNQNSEFPVVLIIVAAVFLFIGIRTIKKKKILKGHSSSEYIEEKKAKVWGWIYTVLGILFALLFLIMII
ncbi:MAG: hypothetical protein ACOC5F_03610 [Candidatus Aminicenantaceae bacterium]